MRPTDHVASHRSRSRRAGPLFGVVLVIGGLLASVAPVVPAARAVDPSPSEPAPTPVPKPSSAVPTLRPTPTSAPKATAAPTPTEEPTAEPVPTDSPGPGPSPTPGPVVTPSPPGSPGPTVAPSASPSAEPSATPSDDPCVAPSPDPSADPSAAPTPDPCATPTPEPTPEPTPAALQVSHGWVDTVDTRGRIQDETDVDQPLEGAGRFEVYVVSAQIVNPTDDDIELSPVLQVRAAGGDWVRVPEVDPVIGVPFYAASDDGRTFKARTTTIGVGLLRLAAPPEIDPDATPVAGRSSAGINPIARMTLPGHSYTEVAFAVRGTMNAAWETGYEFRVVVGGEALPGPKVELTMSAKPPPDLSPGQRSGRPTDKPKYGLVAPVDMAAGPAAQASLAGLQLPFGAPGNQASPHRSYSLTTDACAACHESHQASGYNLLAAPTPQSTLCFQCHDGTGANSDVEAQFSSASLPANDPATGSYYSHPATETSSHTSDREDEFGGVSNRHAQCADCHQPHNATPQHSTEQPDGWLASGAIAGAAGVSVTNGDAGTEPVYALQRTSTLEYELCFKCHSGFTVLNAQDPAHPSRWALDKGVELNPANVSYHPVEAAGRNTSTAMQNSLSGTSPAKRWSFSIDSTIRCANCHGSPASIAGANPPNASAVIDTHASSNRGILVAPYRDRDLKGPNELYNASDFSLCYVCHAESPMVDDSGDPLADTNFNWHGYHLANLTYTGTGSRDIDAGGAGQGNAVCAECHFRTHGTALAVNGQEPATGLVNFAPNVQPANGVVRFVPATPTAYGSCTLTCHGKVHVNYPYAYGTTP
jgi:predicted CXXCH cytochrome family protein